MLRGSDRHGSGSRPDEGSRSAESFNLSTAIRSPRVWIGAASGAGLLTVALLAGSGEGERVVEGAEGGAAVPAEPQAGPPGQPANPVGTSLQAGKGGSEEEQERQPVVNFDWFDRLVLSQLAVQSEELTNDQREAKRTAIREEQARDLGRAMSQLGFKEKVWEWLERSEPLPQGLSVLPPDMENWLLHVAVDLELAQFPPLPEEESMEVAREMRSQAIHRSEGFRRLNREFHSYLGAYPADQSMPYIDALHGSILHLRELIPYQGDVALDLSSQPSLDSVGSIHLRFLSHPALENLEHESTDELNRKLSSIAERHRRQNVIEAVADCETEYVVALMARCFGDETTDAIVREEEFGLEGVLRNGAIALFGMLGASGRLDELRADALLSVSTLQDLTVRQRQLLYTDAAKHGSGQALLDLIWSPVDPETPEELRDLRTHEKLTAIFAVLSEHKVSPTKFQALLTDAAFDPDTWSDSQVSEQEWAAIAVLRGLPGYWKGNDLPDPLWASEALALAEQAGRGSIGGIELAPRVMLTGLEVMAQAPSSLLADAGYPSLAAYYTACIRDAEGDSLQEGAAAEAWMSAPVPEPGPDRERYVFEIRDGLGEAEDAGAAWALSERLWQVELAPADMSSQELVLDRYFIEMMMAYMEAEDAVGLRQVVDKALGIARAMDETGLANAISWRAVDAQEDPLLFSVVGDRGYPRLKESTTDPDQAAEIDWAFFLVPDSLRQVERLLAQVHDPMTSPFPAETLKVR